MIKTFPDINGSFTIINGKLKVEVLTNENGLIKDELTQLLTLRDVLMEDAIRNYERNNQAKMAEGYKEYILPKGE